MTTVALLALFAAVSQNLDLPKGLLASVCWVESSYNVEAINIDDGRGDSIGVCQVKVQTARMLGFKGTERQLQNPRVNSYYAGLYLRNQLRRYSGSLDKGVASYNSGTWRIDVNGNTKNQKYVDKVLKKWKGIRSETTKLQTVPKAPERQRREVQGAHGQKDPRRARSSKRSL